MNVYSLPVTIDATAYIRASSAEEALAIANSELADNSLELSDRHQFAGDNICIYGGSFAALADIDEDVSFSPAMSLNTTAYELDDVDLAEENIHVE